MSAIFGRVELDGRPVVAASFRACFDRLKRYGPDLSETSIEGPVAVGRHLLAISPSARNERLEVSYSGTIIVADAILDNRPELGTSLGFSPSDLAKLSDTDLIRASFERWGADCGDHLIGDFAFVAISPAPYEITMVRDHIGSRPLFWSRRNQTLIFSTSIEGIVSFDEWKWSIDPRIVAEYLFCPLKPVSKPFFEHIHTVPSGSSVVFRGANVSTRQWWHPSVAPQRNFNSNTEVTTACRTILERAISDRLGTGGATGAHLSGGIDSTGVAVIASRELRKVGQSLRRGYAWSPAVSERHPANHVEDERARIQAIADKEHIPMRFGVNEAPSLMDFIQRPMELEGEADLADEIPLLDTARDDGISVMLSGWGGDEGFSSHGHGHFVGLLLAGKLEKARRFAKSSRGSLRGIRLLYRLVWHDVIYPLLPLFAFRLASPQRKLIKHASFMSAALRSKHADLIVPRYAIIKFGASVGRNLLAFLMAGHVTMRMETWAAWSAPSGFQYRYPLTDRRLLEFLLTLPPDKLYLNNRPRGLARAVLADCIPRSTSKSDPANEHMRTRGREQFWQTLARQTADGEYDQDCPWLDTAAFRVHALNPTDQSLVKNVVGFVELFAAARVFALYRRAVANGWV